MLVITSPRLPLLPAILSQRGLGSAVVHLPTLAQEGEGILRERWPGVSHPGKRATKWRAQAERGR